MLIPLGMAEWCIPFYVTLTLTLTSGLISRLLVSGAYLLLTYIILYLGYLGMPSLKVGLLFKFRNVSYLLGHPVYSHNLKPFFFQKKY